MVNDKPIITMLKCNCCGYTWYPRVPQLPKVCPSCKHRQWNEEVQRVRKKLHPKIK